jgi:O6-methylguanine-DNA--protein-cysteine methyltransferase
MDRYNHVVSEALMMREIFLDGLLVCEQAKQVTSTVMEPKQVTSTVMEPKQVTETVTEMVQVSQTSANDSKVTQIQLTFISRVWKTVTRRPRGKTVLPKQQARII